MHKPSQFNRTGFCFEALNAIAEPEIWKRLLLVIDVAPG